MKKTKAELEIERLWDTLSSKDKKQLIELFSEKEVKKSARRNRKQLEKLVQNNPRPT